MSNTMTAQFKDLFTYSKEIKQKTELKAIDLKNGYIAVNQKDFIDNQLKSEIEYVTNKDNAKTIIFIRNKINDKAISCDNMPLLYDKKVLEEVRTRLIYEIDFDKFIINNPYSYIKQTQDTNMDSVVLLNVDLKNQTVKAVNGSCVPMAMYFDSFQHNLTDEYYNIKQVGVILQLRKDIHFQYFDKENKNIYRKEITFENNEKKDVVSIVPFIWIPTSTDFKRYLNFYHHILNMEGYKQEFVDCNTYILNEIFGLMSAKISL